MKRIFAILFLLVAGSMQAHLGSPNVLVDGMAGPYSARVIIKPPEVIPGLAEISVRINNGRVKTVHVLPIFWKSGRKGSPPPDEALLIRRETNLYSARLWFMSAGTYLVEVSINGDDGPGTLTVPVNAMATNTRPMSTPYAIMLASLGIFLLIAGARIAGLIFLDSLLEPGSKPGPAQIRRSRVVMVLAAVCMMGAAWGGKKWWDFEEAEYRNNRLYTPAPVFGDLLTTNNTLVLRLTVDDSNHRGKWTRLIPDHGKLMHLFLVRELDLKIFAHLHPRQSDKKRFETLLPPLPSGNYRIYGDVTHENGFAETLTGSVSIKDPLPGNYLLPAIGSSEAFCAAPTAPNQPVDTVPGLDPDDSWHIEKRKPGSSATENENDQMVVALDGGHTMVWLNRSLLTANKATTLRFSLETPDQRSALLQYYMGMAGHLVFRSMDGKVFSHVHPQGTFSMAAQHFFAAREATNDLSTVNPSIAGLSSPASSAMNISTNLQTQLSEVSFPCSFPRPGAYRVWVQLKSGNQVFTGAFDLEVDAK